MVSPMSSAAPATPAVAYVRRHRAPSGNRDGDRFQAVCPAHPEWIAAAHSNRTTAGRTLAERDRDQHNRARHGA